jgi:uncharacterized protein
VHDFEWDDGKAQRNLAKHGGSFEAARLVFDDVFAVGYLDFGGHATEERYVTTGLAKGVLLKSHQA